MMGRAGSLALWSLSQRLKMLGMFSGDREKKKKKTTAERQKESKPVCLIKEHHWWSPRQHPSLSLHRKGRTIAVLRVWKGPSLPRREAAKHFRGVSGLHIPQRRAEPGCSGQLPAPPHSQPRRGAGAEGASLPQTAGRAVPVPPPFPFQPPLRHVPQARPGWGSAAARRALCTLVQPIGKGHTIGTEKVGAFSPLTFVNFL